MPSQIIHLVTTMVDERLLTVKTDKKYLEEIIAVATWEGYTTNDKDVEIAFLYGKNIPQLFLESKMEIDGDFGNVRNGLLLTPSPIKIPVNYQFKKEEFIKIKVVLPTDLKIYYIGFIFVWR